MQAIITCAKSWHTPLRLLRTWSTGVETVVARWSYLNSVKTRWQRSIAASSKGRPLDDLERLESFAVSMPADFVRDLFPRRSKGRMYRFEVVAIDDTLGGDH